MNLGKVINAGLTKVGSESTHIADDLSNLVKISRILMTFCVTSGSSGVAILGTTSPSTKFVRQETSARPPAVRHEVQE